MLRDADAAPAAFDLQTLPRHLGVELKHLRFFVAVAEHRSFVRAAERLHTSQSAVSKFIHRLEEIVGTPLFFRDTRNVEITFAGEELLTAAKEILRLTEDAVYSARLAKAGVTSSLAIGYMDVAMMSSLPAIISSFRKAYPNIVLNLTYAWTDRQRDMLLDGELDLGFLYSRTGAHVLDSLTLERMRLVAVLPAKHPLAEKPAIRIAELQNLPFVIGVWRIWRALNEQIFRSCGKHGFTPAILQEVHFRDEMFGLIAAGLAMTIYPASALNGLRDGIRVVELVDCEEDAELIVGWKKGNTNPSLFHFVNHLKAMQTNGLCGVPAQDGIAL